MTPPIRPGDKFKVLRNSPNFADVEEGDTVTLVDKYDNSVGVGIFSDDGGIEWYIAFDDVEALEDCYTEPDYSYILMSDLNTDEIVVADEEVNESKKYDDGKPPVVQGFMHYFPRAIKAVSMLSVYGVTKYEVTLKERNFAGLDQERLLDADGRHILDEAIDGPYDPESGLLHSVHHAWEAMARLERQLTDMEEKGEPIHVDVDGMADW